MVRRMVAAAMVAAIVAAGAFSPKAYCQAPQIYAGDGHYLGNLSANRFDQDSIFNRFGRYGSRFSQDSIFNPFGPYGSRFSPYSPFNRFATSPPVLVSPGQGSVSGYPMMTGVDQGISHSRSPEISSSKTPYNFPDQQPFYGYNYGGVKSDNTAAWVAGGIAAGIVLGAIVYHVMGAPSSGDAQTLKSLEKYKYQPPQRTDRELEQIRRGNVSAKLISAGVEVPANMAVAELQDMNGRVRLSRQIISTCGKAVDWRKYSLRQLNEMWIGDKCE